MKGKMRLKIQNYLEGKKAVETCDLLIKAATILQFAHTSTCREENMEMP